MAVLLRCRWMALPARFIYLGLNLGGDHWQHPHKRGFEGGDSQAEALRASLVRMVLVNSKRIVLKTTSERSKGHFRMSMVILSWELGRPRCGSWM